MNGYSINENITKLYRQAEEEKENRFREYITKEYPNYSKLSFRDRYEIRKQWMDK